MYYGLDGDMAPYDIKEVVVAPDVKIIKKNAFSGCRSLKKITMGDSVEKIELFAFRDCSSLKNIRLSTSLRSIIDGYPSNVVFLPQSVEEIGGKAFFMCKNLKLIMLPPTIDPDRIGGGLTNDPNDHSPILRICTDPDVTVPIIQKFVEEHGESAFFQIDDKCGLAPLHIVCGVLTSLPVRMSF